MADGIKDCENDNTWKDVQEQSTKVAIPDTSSVLNGTEITRDDSSGELAAADFSSNNSRPENSALAKSLTPIPSALSPSASTSLPNFLKVPSWESKLTSGRQSVGPMAGVSSSPSPAARAKPDVASVKSEDDIKIYVERTMNELLGWYGLPKMDNSEAHHLNISNYPISMAQRSPNRPASAASSRTPTATATCSSVGSKRCGMKARDDRVNSKLPSDSNNNSNSCGADDEDEDDDDHDDIDEDDVHVGGGMSSFQDSFSSGYEASGLVSPASGGGEVPDSERGVAIVCSWCQQNGNKLFTLESTSGNKSFCSEVCFTQCRRASFKRNKVCEWCKHVRHTLNFVDFQDGDVQLQFCSEKCLNQYKMNIFCTEARQHLEQIQNMAGEEAKSVIGPGKGGKHEKEILITPDLWLSAHSNPKMDIKEEVNEDEQEAVVSLGKHTTMSARRVRDGEDSGEIQDSEVRWPGGAETRSILSDHSSCSNDDRGSQKVKTLLMARQKKDRPTSRYVNSNSGSKTASNSCYHDRDRSRKSIPGINGDSNSHKRRQNTPCGKEKDAYPSVSHQKSATFPSGISAAAFNPQHMSALSMMPNWAASQLLTMMPSSSFSGTNINSSLGGLGYLPNTLLYSSLFGPNSLPMTAQKDTASSSLTSTRTESRREARTEKSFERERGNIRGESTERSTRSASSSYSSSDTPGPSSTPGATVNTIPEPTTSFIPGFNQHLHHPLQTADLGQTMPIPQFLNDQAMSGLYPLGYNLNHAQRNGPSLITGLPTGAQVPHHTPPVPTAAPQQLPIPPVTVLVPYPIAVPIPVPIPIPLPIAPEKLFAFFKEKSTQSKATTSTPSTQQWLPEHRSTSPQVGRPGAPSVSHSSISPGVSSHNSPKAVPFLCHPYGSSMTILNSPDPALVLPSGRDSADSILTLRRETAGSHHKPMPTSPCSSTSLKRTHLPTRHLTLDPSKKPRLDYHPPVCSEDEAIDLSKMSSRSSSPRVSGNCSEKENSTLVKQASLSDTDADSSSQTSTLAVPRIHIITEHGDPPLCQSSGGVTLPSPSQQSNYSGRRSRILDAPSIPRKVRSPSPERRYVRTVPRDMVEAARRRGLRARVRTK